MMKRERECMIQFDLSNDKELEEPKHRRIFRVFCMSWKACVLVE